MDKGIKELLELIAGLKELALVGKAVMKDGKIGIDDLGALTVLLTKTEVLMAAFQDLGKLGDEFKGMDLDEAMSAITALIDAAKEVKAA